MTLPIADINMENAQSLLIDESFKRPVLVDFWASWCEPCKNLAPILDKIAEECAGDFLLAKVDAEDQQQLAAQFGVRSLPTVMLIKDGQPADGFAGLKTEQEIRELLSKYLPKPWDKQLVDARQLIEEGESGQALVLLREAFKNSRQQADIALVLAQTLIAGKRLDEAESVLAQVKLVDQDSAHETLKAELDLAREAQKAPELQLLEQSHAENPEDMDVAFQLAVQYSQHQYRKEALELMYKIIQQDINFKAGEAKQIYLDILAVLGKGDPIAIEFQRKLFTLLH